MLAVHRVEESVQVLLAVSTAVPLMDLHLGDESILVAGIASVSHVHLLRAGRPKPPHPCRLVASGFLNRLVNSVADIELPLLNDLALLGQELCYLVVNLEEIVDLALRHVRSEHRGTVLERARLTVDTNKDL